MPPKKTKLIKKKRNNSKQVKTKSQKPESLQQTTESHFEVVEPLKQVESLPCCLKQLCELPNKKLQYIKKTHPLLATYYFLKPRQRSKFFHELNHKFRKQIRPATPPGSAPKKKTIKFKKRFQIKLFNKNQKPKTVQNMRTFTQRQVRNVHFK